VHGKKKQQYEPANSVTQLPVAVAAWSYGLAAIGFTLFALQLGIGWRGDRRAAVLLATMALSAIWAGAALVFALTGNQAADLASRVADSARLLAWLGFLVILLQGRRRFQRETAVDWAGLGLLFLAAVLLMLVWVGPLLTPIVGFSMRQAEIAAPLGAVVILLSAVEQLFRRAPKGARWAVSPLCLGLGGAFSFDLFLYSDALLFQQFDPSAWSARGIVNALVIPFIALTTARTRDWTLDIAVSRSMVFHSTAFLAAGIYLLAVAAAGYYVRYFGGEWGKTLQIAFVFAALLGFGLLLSSGTLRARLRVFINKNFFSYRYDYRAEWLKIIALLSSKDSNLSLYERSIKALADLIESPSGMLWLAEEQARRYFPAASWNMATTGDFVDKDEPLEVFLTRTGWIIDLEEFRTHPSRYEGLVIPENLGSIHFARLILPIATSDELIGFVLLAKPRVPVELNWEVRDLLKAAAQQIGSFLGHTRTTEALIEARQFDAFNRMSAFVVHDLKNLVAQLSLMLKNAERHHDNPEFQRDMLETVRNVVERMNGMLQQLRAGTTPFERPRRIDLGDLAQRVARAKASAGRQVDIEAEQGVETLAHPDRLERVVGHLVQNALDATSGGGSVRLRVHRESDECVLEVVDTGVGMSPEFVRSQLFRPFLTTKSTGTGIGAYESTQYVSALGGRMHVQSELGKGTRVTIVLRSSVRATDGEARDSKQLA
jgi:putative PEP-CTERM system histidine kinase